MTFHPYNSNLRLAAGTEFPFEIWGQAHDFGDIQLWLDGNNPNNLSWSIMGQTGTFHEADKIYGTGIYSQDLVNPLVTPEPSTFALLAVAAVAGIIYRRCRRRQ